VYEVYVQLLFLGHTYLELIDVIYA